MNAALTHDALADAIKRTEKRANMASRGPGQLALIAIGLALEHLSRVQNEILAALPDGEHRALEYVADCLCDLSSNVAGHYAAEDRAAAERAAEPVRLERVA